VKTGRKGKIGESVEIRSSTPKKRQEFKCMSRDRSGDCGMIIRGGRGNSGKGKGDPTVNLSGESLQINASTGIHQKQ